MLLFSLDTLYALLSFIIFGYLLSRVLKRNDIADVLWGLGFIFLAYVNLDFSNLSFRGGVVFLLLIVWGLRLSMYIFLRSLNKSEDKRYASWRKEWGVKEPWMAFLQVFLLQGIFMVIISAPILYTLQSSKLTPLGPFDFFGVCLFIIGFLFEFVSDAQMYFFKKSNSKEKVLNEGLWSFCRHPNYLGEIFIWWGFYFIACSLQNGVFTIVSPLLLTFLLLKVSGVPMLEKILNKNQAFSNYVSTTPAIVPFHKQDVLVFLVIVITLVGLDFFWLGFLMKDFYHKQLGSLLTLNVWPIVGVYIFIGLGLYLFAIKKSQNTIEAFLWGGIFGLVSYSIYEFTNLSLVLNWPVEMALVDIIWGVVLCGLSAVVGKFVQSLLLQQ